MINYEYQFGTHKIVFSNCHVGGESTIPPSLVQEIVGNPIHCTFEGGECQLEGEVLVSSEKGSFYCESVEIS